MIIAALDVTRWPALSCLVSSTDIAGGLQKVRSPTAMNFFTFYFSSLGSFITSQLNDQLSAGSLAQVVERCTGIAEFKVLNSLPAWIFLGFLYALQKLRLSLMIVFTWNTIFFLTLPLLRLIRRGCCARTKDIKVVNIRNELRVRRLISVINNLYSKMDRYEG